MLLFAIGVNSRLFSWQWDPALWPQMAAEKLGDSARGDRRGGAGTGTTGRLTLTPLFPSGNRATEGLSLGLALWVQLRDAWGREGFRHPLCSQGRRGWTWDVGSGPVMEKFQVAWDACLSC